MKAVTTLLILVAFTTINFSPASAETDKLICYYAKSFLANNFTIEDIDAHLCTHIVYAFVELNDDATVKLDADFDIKQKSLERFVNLKDQNKKLKVMVALGGNTAASRQNSILGESSEMRTAASKNIVQFLIDYRLDGIDLNWQYPARAVNSRGRPQDKQDFADFVTEMRNQINKSNKWKLLLTAVVAPTAMVIDTYQVDTLVKELDWIHLVTFDLQTSFNRTAQSSPLYASIVDTTYEETQKNVDACVKTWLSHGAKPKNLVIGIGTFGHDFTLKDNANHKLGDAATGPGEAGWSFKQKGVLKYYEICVMLRDQVWKTIWDDQQRMPYSYREDQWIGYENIKSVTDKAIYARSNKLAGAMVWSLAEDDCFGICGKRYPLLNAIKENLLT